MSPQTIVTWLSLATAVALGAARFNSLEEAKGNNVKWIADLSEVTKNHESRVQALEKSNDMLLRLHALEVRLVELETREKEHRRR